MEILIYSVRDIEWQGLGGHILKFCNYMFKRGNWSIKNSLSRPQAPGDLNAYFPLYFDWK